MSTKDIAAEVFDSSNYSPREQVTEWVKIKEKLGNKVAGYFLGFWEKPAEGVYRRQVSIALRDFNNPAIVYGVTLPDYFEKDLALYRMNDRVGFEYHKDIPAKEPGVSPTKAVRASNLDLKKRREEGTATATVTSTPKDTSSMPSEDVEDEGPGF